jgi:hypothetical protein
MPATKRFLNWTGVTFTPTGQDPISITGVTSLTLQNHGGGLLKFSGDGDRYMTTVVPDVVEPEITLQSADMIALRSLPVGIAGTLSATHNDARNGTGQGAITYTMANAVVASNTVLGEHRKFGRGTVTFAAFSGDGQTHPITSSVQA